MHCALCVLRGGSSGALCNVRKVHALALQVKYCVNGFVKIGQSGDAGYDTAGFGSHHDSTSTMNTDNNFLQVGPFRIRHQQGMCAGQTSVHIQAVFKPLVVGESEAVLEVACKALGRCDVTDQKFIVCVQVQPLHKMSGCLFVTCHSTLRIALNLP